MVTGKSLFFVLPETDFNADFNAPDFILYARPIEGGHSCK